MNLHRARPCHPPPLQRWARRGRASTRRDSAPPRPRPSGLSDARTLRAGGERLLGFRRSARGELCDLRPQPPRPAAQATGSVSSGVKSRCRRRRRPSPLGHLTHLSADRRIPAGQPPGSRPAGCGRPRPRGGIPGGAERRARRSGSGGRSNPLPAEGRGTGTRPRKALGPQPGGQRAAPGTRRTLPPACAGTSFPRPLVRPEPLGRVAVPAVRSDAVPSPEPRPENLPRSVRARQSVLS